jgi:hypothetical protein
MNKGKNKQIDYLFEDPVLPDQKFAIISIIGPHMPQKCDVWGLKVRGTANSLEKAKMMSQKLMKIDNNYDIFTVEVGKFFPLVVDPLAVGNVEYQNSQLNDLMKSYLENKAAAEEQWHARKNDMVQQAIKEGREQELLASKPEHPIAVLQRIKSFEEQMKELEEMLESTKENLQMAQDKFSKYTDEERQKANNELLNAISSNVDENSEIKIEEIRDQFVNDLVISSNSESSASGSASGSGSASDVSDILNEISLCEKELNYLNQHLSNLSENDTPNIYKQTNITKQNMEKKLHQLKQKLNNKNLVNNFINSNYQGSQLNSFMDS